MWIDAKKFTVVNGSDDTWSVRSEGNEINTETSTINSTKKPKTIDFTPTEGDGIRISIPWDLSALSDNWRCD